MFGRWAEWCVTKVHWSRDRTHVERVRARPGLLRGLGPEGEFERDQLRGLLELGHQVITVHADGGTWHKGQALHLVEVDGDHFLRADRERAPHDDLGRLPEF